MHFWLPGYGGRTVPHRFTVGADGRRHLGIMLPGLGYRTDMPLLYYAAAALRSRGFALLAPEYAWDTADGFQEADDATQLAWIGHEVGNTLRWAHAEVSADRVVVVAKSLSCLALATTLKREALPEPAEVIWLTPPLAIAEMREAFPSNLARSRVLIGTADRHYRQDVLDRLRASGHEVLVFEGCDHGLELGADPLGSVEVLAKIVRELVVPEPSDKCLPANRTQ